MMKKKKAKPLASQPATLSIARSLGASSASRKQAEGFFPWDLDCITYDPALIRVDTEERAIATVRGEEERRRRKPRKGKPRKKRKRKTKKREASQPKACVAPAAANAFVSRMSDLRRAAANQKANVSNAQTSVTFILFFLLCCFVSLFTKRKKRKKMRGKTKPNVTHSEIKTTTTTTAEVLL